MVKKKYLRVCLLSSRCSWRVLISTGLQVQEIALPVLCCQVPCFWLISHPPSQDRVAMLLSLTNCHGSSQPWNNITLRLFLIPLISFWPCRYLWRYVIQCAIHEYWLLVRLWHLCFADDVHECSSYPKCARNCEWWFVFWSCWIYHWEFCSLHIQQLIFQWCSLVLFWLVSPLMPFLLPFSFLKEQLQRTS